MERPNQRPGPGGSRAGEDQRPPGRPQGSRVGLLGVGQDRQCRGHSGGVLSAAGCVTLTPGSAPSDGLPPTASLPLGEQGPAAPQPGRSATPRCQMLRPSPRPIRPSLTPPTPGERRPLTHGDPTLPGSGRELKMNAPLSAEMQGRGPWGAARGVVAAPPAGAPSWSVGRGCRALPPVSISWLKAPLDRHGGRC